jgi:nicotinamide mononucleotide transporter
MQIKTEFLKNRFCLHQMIETLTQIAEWVSVAFSMLYLLLLGKRNLWCWFFGITGSIVGVALMLHTGLLGQAVIYAYYVGIGVYGWWYWNKSDGMQLAVCEWRFQTHVWLQLSGAALAVLCGYILHTHTSATQPYVDASLTVFGFIGSWMQARRVLSSWIYWFAIDAGSAWLYYQNGLYVFAALMVVYCVLCVRGYIHWNANYLKQPD